jgi:hypothetical protein
MYVRPVLIINVYQFHPLAKKKLGSLLGTVVGIAAHGHYRYITISISEGQYHISDVFLGI